MLQHARAGAIAGVVGGIVFGMLMAMMGMLTVIAGMVGSSSPVVGFAIHLLMSAMIGAGFGVALGALATSAVRAVGAGVAYGMTWWVIGPLTMMPLMMGQGLGAAWNGHAIAAALPSLMGHVIYGAITGFVFLRLQPARKRTGALRTA
ncbi:MAG: hypothetical protein HY059_11080 [Proteobacteria bacterium]|nr:hypothetical protein [Pseudomonadota bacterium]